jgi:hypothetical protein
VRPSWWLRSLAATVLCEVEGIPRRLGLLCLVGGAVVARLMAACSAVVGGVVVAQLSMVEQWFSSGNMVV